VLTIPAKIIATCFALVTFVAALVLGVAVDNPAGTVIFKALVAMLLCWGVGYAVGLVAQHVVDLNIQRYKKIHPIIADGGNETQEASAQEQNFDVVEDGGQPTVPR